MPEYKTVNSVIKGLDIFKRLSNGTDRISDLSKELHLSKSTVHRLLKTLEISKLVMQDPITHRYYLGPLIHDLAAKPFIAHRRLIFSALNEMEYLRDLTRETTVLHIRIGLDRLCLEETQSPENVKYTAGKGSITPIYIGSAGKVLLSELQEDELQLILKNLRLIPVGPHTITEKKTLVRELEKVKRQGYATSFGEREPGSASISFPVKNYICPVALSILGPDNRFSMKVMMNVLDKMRESAGRISGKLIEMKEKGESR